MDAVGLDIPADMEVAAQGKGPGLSDLFPIDQEEKERLQKQREKWESMSPEERREENYRKPLAYLTEAGCLSQSAASAEQ